ncbi:hypothetical protein LCGC14_1469880 [marine sediment metagenome]|uniref:Glycosyl transferase family 1 domain-containing protein n=1 Tax=marine sediment metagenome TaxID=412755 RepID=A0A0F9MEH8_9ZZZZ
MKIFTAPWHCGHQSDLFNALSDCQFDLLINNCRSWAENSRPLPKNARMVSQYSPGKYDLAILDLDQQCIDEQKSCKGLIYRELNDLIQDIPKIVINHGSPVWPECHEPKEIIDGIKKLVGNNVMVVNSYQAKKEWGFGRTIIHGMGLDEWHDLPKDPRIVTAVSPAGLNTYYNRRLYDATKKELAKNETQIVHFRINILFNDWNEYRDYLGRSLIYFDYSLHTPMNRARTEAMLSGCCIVTAKNHDVERFIENGVNGFIIPNNPFSASKLLNELMMDYDRCIKVGRAGKQTARKLFNRNRYSNDWIKLIQGVL